MPFNAWLRRTAFDRVCCRTSARVKVVMSKERYRLQSAQSAQQARTAEGFFVFHHGRHLPNQSNLLSAKRAALSLTSAAALP
jgi:hypothetical protein